MERIKRQMLSTEEKQAFDLVSQGMRLLLNADKPPNKRMRYAVIRLEGDRCKPVELEIKYRNKNKD